MAIRLTNVQKYAIQGMLGDDKTITQVAKVLKVPEDVVQRYVDKTTEAITKIDESVNQLKSSDEVGFINTTMGKKAGPTIMTKEASEKVDAGRTRKKKDNRALRGAIFNPKTQEVI